MFQPEKSSTFHRIDGSDNQLEYYSVTVDVDYGTDTVQFGQEFEESRFTINEFKFGLAHRIYDHSTSASDSSLVGIFGLSPSSTSRSSQSAFTQMRQHLDHPIFHLYLEYGGEELEGGKIEYGTANVDSQLCAHDAVTFPFPSDSYSFCVSLSVYFDDGAKHEGEDFHTVSALVDSGSNFILGPPEEVKKLAETVGATRDQGTTGPYHIPCAYAEQGKDIVFTAPGKQKLRVSARNYVVTMHDNEDVCLFGFADGSGDRRWIMGTPFLRGYCASFDLGKHEMSFRQRL
ncbi:hypothetical protein QR680_003962 [Steinernema hermaphroditum]|uniref:Peptidase A1 domain-containing protein n=1 Tax=Steinernema hermaphroditum TaxID=289476 RepID=A0AA39HM79_9BILA|nr:hypothetical protein QR680_003962 [Steinernema hermaphroditum]